MTPRPIAAKLALLTLAAPAALLTLATPAAAQDIQAFKPAVGSWNYFAVDGTRVVEPGRFVPSFYLSYARNPLVERNEQDEVVDLLVENLTTAELLLAIGLHERFEVGVAVPFGYGAGSGKLDVDTGAGLGDLRLLPKVVLLGAGEAHGFGLALQTPLSFPTGDADKGNSARHFIATGEVVIEYRLGIGRLAANAGYRWRPVSEDGLEPLTVGSGFVYGAGLAVPLGTPRVEAIAEAYGTLYDDVSQDEGGPSPLEALGGIRLFNDSGLVFTLAAGTGLVAHFGAPELRVIGGLMWVPDDRDPGYVDASRVAVADGDDDGDGIKNSADLCLSHAEDPDGYEDNDGCPDSDNDQDGIADADDKCPKHAEDRDGFEDIDGCPDLDNDDDGIADASDRCPDLPENRNDWQDDDGCPDTSTGRSIASAPNTPDVVLHPDRIQHLKKIYFDQRRATIRPESFDILDQVAEVIKSRPEIRKVRVEGHTDTHGTDGFNIWLSRARAQAVRKYLIGAGIEPDRLEAVGIGESEPIGDGMSQLDAARSRRVEFLIRERDPESPPPASPHREEGTASAAADDAAKASPDAAH